MKPYKRYLGFDMDHTAELFKVCGVAILAAVSLNLLGRLSGGISILLRVGAGILIFGIIVALLRENIDTLKAVLFTGEGGDFTKDAFTLMLKALGVALVSRFCADVCRDCGENTLAGGVENAGKIVMVSLSLPILAQILERASEILEMGS